MNVADILRARLERDRSTCPQCVMPGQRQRRQNGSILVVCVVCKLRWNQ